MISTSNIIAQESGLLPGALEFKDYMNIKCETGRLLILFFLRILPWSKYG